MTDPRTQLRQAIIGQLSRPIDNITAWADDMIRWLDTHGWRPAHHVPDWRAPTHPAEPPTGDYLAARAAIRTTPPQEHP